MTHLPVFVVPGWEQNLERIGLLALLNHNGYRDGVATTLHMLSFYVFLW